jgi:predicted SAM-dependent methyltransferase
LNEGGHILLSTPDLKKYDHLYSSDKINQQNWDWPLKRIYKDAPKSFYFSIFSHSLPGKLQWDYDAEGLIYQLERSGKFKNITEIPLDENLANSPFNHNKAWEDVYVMAQLK